MAGEPTMTDWLGLYARELSAVVGSLAAATSNSARSEVLGVYAAEGCARSLRKIAAELDKEAAAASIRLARPSPDTTEGR